MSDSIEKLPLSPEEVFFENCNYSLQMNESDLRKEINEVKCK
jgi:hypothetical protein